MKFDPQSNRIDDVRSEVHALQREAKPRRARGDGLVFFLVVAGMLGGGWFCVEKGTVSTVGAAASITPIRVPASTSRRPVVSYDTPSLESAQVETPAPTETETEDDGDDLEIVDAALRRGRLLCGMGRYREAIPVLDEAVVVDPDAADVRYQLAIAHIRMRDMGAARAQLIVLEELDPSLANLLKNLVR